MAKRSLDDRGTPLGGGAPLTLSIDGIEVTVPAGTSVMRAAVEAGVKVPKLCATDTLQPFGSCRLCLVEIEGRKGTPASCTTPVEAGMAVRTQSERLGRLRRGVMELYISDHPLDCLTCAANGDCELQDMAGVVGLREVRYGMDGANHRAAAADALRAVRDPAYRMAVLACARHLAGERVAGPRSYWTRLGTLTTPSYWIFGRGDRLVDPRYAERVGAVLPGARIELWDDVGHVPQFEVPERTSDAIATWLETVRG